MEKKLSLIPIYGYVNLKVPFIRGIDSFEDFEKTKLKDVIQLIHWPRDFSFICRKRMIIKSCRAKVFLISSEKYQEIEFTGEGILSGDDKYYFKDLSQIFFLIINNLNFFQELLWSHTTLPIIPFRDEKNGLSVAYITRGDKSRHLCFEKYENFQKRRFRIYTYGPEGKPKCSISSDQYCLIVPKN